MDDIACKKIAQNLDRDDMVMTAMSTFVSTTVHCARCHDHKFDPITQAEYYGLQADFAGVDRVDRPYDPDPERVSHAGGALTQGEGGAGRGRAPARQRRAAGPAGRGGPRGLQKAFDARDAGWTVLDPARLASRVGVGADAAAGRLDPRGGPLPETDTLHRRRPRRTCGSHRGPPGRVQPTTASPTTAPAASPTTGTSRSRNSASRSRRRARTAATAAGRATAAGSAAVALGAPSADFNQKDWGIDKALDGKSETGWAIDPQEGAGHFAVFPLKEPAGFEGGTLLTFTLEQKYGRKHLIGRFRLSVTTTAPPPRADAVPYAAGQAAVGAGRRGAARRRRRSCARRVRGWTGSRSNWRPSARRPRCTRWRATSSRTASSTRPRRRGRCSCCSAATSPDPAAAAVPGALACVPGSELAVHRPRPQRRIRPPGGAGGVGRPTRRNALTWRSIVNRVWQYHFGRGIVETPNDFGHMGARPTHPELLDWLAVTFRDGGGSLKQLHRLIVTSAAYRQCVRRDADPDGDRGPCAGVRRHRRREPVPLADEPHPPRRRVRARRDPPGQRPAGPDDGRAVGEAVQVRRPQRRGDAQGRLRRASTWTAPSRAGGASTATCSARCRTRSWTASTAPTPRSSPPGATRR